MVKVNCILFIWYCLFIQKLTRLFHPIILNGQMIDKYLIITYSNINELNEIGLLSKDDVSFSIFIKHSNYSCKYSSTHFTLTFKRIETHKNSTWTLKHNITHTYYICMLRFHWNSIFLTSFCFVKRSINWTCPISRKRSISFSD